MAASQSTPRHWTSTTLLPSDGKADLGPAHLRELEAVAAMLDANPVPYTSLDPTDFALDECRELMSQIHAALDDGVGFSIIDRLPVEQLSPTATRGLYWLLLRLLGRPVAQKWEGTMLYEVTDRGRPLGDGVRADVTNVRQNFHCDNSYNNAPPTYVSLLCIRTAKAGGVSGIADVEAVHKRLSAEHPALVERLHNDFYFDRQREHAEHEPTTICHPIFDYDDLGRLRVRTSEMLIRRGYEKAGVPLDPAGDAALRALTDALEAPETHSEFHFEPGQIQILNNLRRAHRRTGFEDWDEPDRKRLLLRLWIRDWGRPFYNA